jgi:hypothetical protein
MFSFLRFLNDLCKALHKTFRLTKSKGIDLESSHSVPVPWSRSPGISFCGEIGPVGGPAAVVHHHICDRFGTAAAERSYQCFQLVGGSEGAVQIEPLYGSISHAERALAVAAGRKPDEAVSRSEFVGPGVERRPFA